MSGITKQVNWVTIFLWNNIEDEVKDAKNILADTA